jgi:hypothetical protein
MVLVDTQTLPQAANNWATLLPPFDSVLAEPFGLPGEFSSSTDVATQAAQQGIANWPGIYVARYNQRDTLAENFVITCGGTANVFTMADKTGANGISTVTPGATGPTLM